jgi:hypothetical protein
MTLQQRAIALDAARVVGATMDRLKSKERTQRIATQRQEWVWLMRRATGMSYPQIGKEVGRDHSTIIHSYNLVEQHYNNGAHDRLERALVEVTPRVLDPLGAEFCNFDPLPVKRRTPPQTELGKLVYGFEIQREECQRRLEALNIAINRLGGADAT